MFKLSTSLVIVVVAVLQIDATSALLGLCESDCDTDAQCEKGLLCAEAHKAELNAKGYDERKANCKVRSQWNFEVCFDAKILTESASGGAGGDPHFRTFDGTPYSFHGQCDLVLAQSPSFMSGMGLDVHARTKIVQGGDWSLMSHAAVKLGDDIFEVSNDGKHYFNGIEQPEFPIIMMNNDLFHITKKVNELEKIDAVTGKKIVDPETFYIINLNAAGDSIKISNFRSMLAVRVDAYLHDTAGMLGVHTKAGLVGRDGQTISADANEMGLQWQVNDSDVKLFRDVTVAPQFPQQCILPTPSLSSRRLRTSPGNILKATNACSSVDEIMRDFCVQDVLLTGDSSLAHGYANRF